MKVRRNKIILHTQAVEQHLRSRIDNKVLGRVAPLVKDEERGLKVKTRRRLAQLRGGKSPFLKSWLNKIDPAKTPDTIVSTM